MTMELRPEQGAFFDLSNRTKLRVSGTDRVRFLNGQISNDVRKATEANAIHACVLSAKGRINADVYIVAERESFLLDGDAALREMLAARLERYVIADDVEIADVTDDFALFHVIPPAAPATMHEGRSVAANRFGGAGTDVWVASSGRDSIRRELSMQSAFCDDACAETFRIERGVPRWGRELTEEIIPTEANLEASAIDYAKGCYIGQEVISRIKMSGQTNKRLCGLVAAADQQLAAGMRLIGEGGKEVGSITSAIMSARVPRWIALGFVKRGFNGIGTRLVARAADAADASASVKIVGLPFV